jgi:TolA-binding protein
MASNYRGLCDQEVNALLMAKDGELAESSQRITELEKINQIAIEILRQVEQSEKAHCSRANSLAAELEKAHERIAELEELHHLTLGTASRLRRQTDELRKQCTDDQKRIANQRKTLNQQSGRITELEAHAERWREWPSDSNEAEYPPDGEQVLIYCGAWASKDYIIGGISKRCGTYGPSGATHWMPKPKAPAIAAQRQKEGE